MLFVSKICGRKEVISKDNLKKSVRKSLCPACLWCLKDIENLTVQLCPEVTKPTTTLQPLPATHSYKTPGQA